MLIDRCLIPPYHPGSIAFQEGSMPVVTVQLLRGKTKEQKAGVAKAITEALREHMGIAPTSTTVVFQEVERTDWATEGVLMSDK